MRCVKKIAMALLLCCYAAACDKDTEIPKRWQRLQARLSSYDLGSINSTNNEPCPDPIGSHKDALRVLLGRPECGDNAIAALKSFGAKAEVLNDLAAAYYIRALRESRDADLLPAFKAARDAVEAAPRDETAQFNLALIEEKLGLSSPGGRQPRWDSNALDLALKNHDQNAVRRLIEPFPAAALEHFEKDVLAADDVEAAKLLAAELSRRLQGDRYVLDAAAAMTRAHEGHVAFHNAKNAATYQDAVRLLKRAGSPVWIAAEFSHAQSLPRDQTTSTHALALLEAPTAFVQRNQYEHASARVFAERAFWLEQQAQLLEELVLCDAALKIFSRLRDTEKEASVRRTISGAYRTLGLKEPAWSEALKAAKLIPHVADLRRRNAILGETATSAAALDFPEAALLYENAAIAMLQNAPRTAQDNVNLNLAVMRRARAQTEIQTGHYDDAEDDLLEAMRLAPKSEKHGTVLTAIQARIHEVHGQSLLHSSPKTAIVAFTAAIREIPAEELTTFRAELFAERAEAVRLAGGDPADDLESAWRELRKEETQMLAGRKRGQWEGVWSNYFSRFEETYIRLIRHHMGPAKRDTARAFNYKERSLAVEPLNLIMRNGVAPPEFRKLVPDDQPMSLAAIQPLLPEGTFLLEYAVLEDRTYAWIVSRDDGVAVQLPVNRGNVERWIGELQRAAALQRRDVVAFERTMKAAFDGLLKRPLALISKLPHGKPPERLVIVPDRRMHGLPFAALYDNDKRKYLIEQIPIELAPSATLYIFSLLRDRQLQSASAPSALLVGDPEFDRKLDLTQGMAPLSFAAAEAIDIAPIYAPNSVVLTGASATPKRFYAGAQDKTIVHFAGHAIANPREPWHSVLLLASSKDDSGVIDAEQLLKNLRLDRTRLVMLSACSTAGGNSVGLEGVAPLVRPLITAGVPAVVGTLWDVNDATTKELSVSFHRHYGQNGLDAAVALQQAQIEMLRYKDTGFHSVLAWAPFQVIGHGSSPVRVDRKRLNGGTHLGIHRTYPVHRDDGLRPQ